MATDNVGVPRALARARRANAARNNAVKVRSQQQKNNSLSDRANSSARVPNIQDVRDAYFSGKVTAHEANELSGTKSFGDPDSASKFSTEHNEYHTHKRAGLN